MTGTQDLLRGRLRRRLIVGVAVGSLAFLFATQLIRSSIRGQSSELDRSVRCELAAENALFEVDRQIGKLNIRLGAWRTNAHASLGQRRGIEQFWRSLQEQSDPGIDETLALVSAAGDLLAAEGPLARDAAELARLLRARSLVGRAGAGGLRSGMVSSEPQPAIGVSIPVYDASAVAGLASSDVPGVSPRIVAISPLEIRAQTVADSVTEVTFYPLHGDGIPERFQDVPARLWRSDGTLEDKAGDEARVFRAVDDASARPTYLLAATVRGTGGDLLSSGALEGLIWELLAVAVTLLLAVRFLSRAVLKPLEGLRGQATRLARSEHGRLEFHSSEDGEIGRLAGALDDMLAKIQADRSEYVRSARIAGMSDVSMGVVHNAGNILNSVNISAKLLSKELAEIGISDLRAMVSELTEHQDDLARYVTEDPNGKFLIPFLFATTEALDDLRTRCLVELESVEHGVGHVIDLIRSQEKYAIGAAVVETTAIADVIDQALNIATLAGDDATDVHIERSFASLDEVQIDRHKLTSILINIISNAVEALHHPDVKEKRLELSLYPMTKDRFVIEIMDTGIGIAPENLDLIFTAAFSTKQNSSGQGLHTTANLCKELGIAIGTVSEGEGCGGSEAPLLVLGAGGLELLEALDDGLHALDQVEVGSVGLLPALLR
ncbi:MAG: ATP-binding protein, partial [Planctomycetota bacterium]